MSYPPYYTPGYERSYEPYSWREHPAFNSPSQVIPIPLTDAPYFHTEKSDPSNCARCQWLARQGALAVHVANGR